MENSLKFKTAVIAYASTATYLMYIISNEMLYACATSALAAHLFCSAVEFNRLLTVEKKKRRHNINFNKNRFYKYRFWFWFNITMYAVLIIKITEMIYFLREYNA